MNNDLTINRIKADIETLGQYTATPGSGATRLPYTVEAKAATKQLKIMMTEAGLVVREDAAGNIFGTLIGEDAEAPAIMTGSHFDTVINGGNFDGQAGIVAGLEVCRLLRDNNVKLKRNLIIAAFNDEEGVRFGSGYFGSKAMLGQFTVDDLHKPKDKDGISVYQAMQNYGLDPEKIGDAKQDIKKIKTFIELRIEQGAVLENKGINIGLVEHIIALQRYIITVSGRADHAGNTPMDMRRDALDAASRVISQISKWVREEGNMVATVGFMKVLPGGINIVPAEVQFSIDIRSADVKHIENVMAKILAELQTATKDTDTCYEIKATQKADALKLCAPIIEQMEKICDKLGYSWLRMVSGAGHDALPIGQETDAVMIFVPSKDGRSHSPSEWTDYEDMAKGVDVIYNLVLELQ